MQKSLPRIVRARAGVVAGAAAASAASQGSVATDPRFGAVLAAMVQKPGRLSTLERMARIAAMSRPAFSGQFEALRGETPYNVLTRLRMEAAEHPLQDTPPFQ